MWPRLPKREVLSLPSDWMLLQDGSYVYPNRGAGLDQGVCLPWEPRGVLSMASLLPSRNTADEKGRGVSWLFVLALTTQPTTLTHVPDQLGRTIRRGMGGGGLARG